MRYETEGGIIETGIDALDFVEGLEGGWDCVVWDPPYYNSSGKNNWENGNTKIANFDLNTMIANTNFDELKQLILDKSSKNVVWIKFHTDLRELNLDNKILIWNKNDRHHQMLNGNCEYIEFTTIKPLYWKTKIFNGPANLGRACAKPTDLFNFLYDIIGCKHVLDPFSGYGNSIRAAMDLGIKIDACDLDDTLDYSEFEDYIPAVKTDQTILDDWV